MYVLGIDVGSTSSKAVILNPDLKVVGAAVVSAGTGSTGPQRVMQEVVKQANLQIKDIKKIAATGYGRFRIEDADKQISEISCHAKGVAYLCPSVRLIIDIGGQDLKAIKLSQSGMVDQFFMSDKCAAGTGRFLEVMARILEIDISQMAEYGSRAEEVAAISSTCTVFAESEVISQLAQGTPKENIIAGIHQSVAVKACGLIRRCSIDGDVVMSGGVAKNSGVVAAIAKELSQEVIVLPESQLAGALGAALFAYEDLFGLLQNNRKKALA
ncbi:MAG: acyl-CoA dehydratase activase [Sporomusaceae bacterium]|nr:acyl-CoA dehydratase activase [Sporomusaceae bacterium]